MKKLLIILAALLVAASVATGCTNKPNDADNNDQNEIVTPGEDSNTEDKEEEDNQVTDPDADKETDTDTDSDAEQDETNTDDKETENQPSTDDNSGNGNTEQPEQPETPSPENPNLPSDNNTQTPDTPTDNGGETETVDLSTKTLSEIIDMIYEKKPVEISVMTSSVDLTNADMLKYNTGLDSADKIKEAAVSEAMIGSQAYSLVLVRVNDSADAADVAQSMKDGINTAKWICVQADDLKVSAYNDLVLLIMVDSQLSDTVTSAEITDAFKEICGGTLSVEL